MNLVNSFKALIGSKTKKKKKCYPPKTKKFDGFKQLKTTRIMSEYLKNNYHFRTSDNC